MGLISLIAPRHNVAAGMRSGIGEVAEQLGDSLRGFEARSNAVHIGNGQVSLGAGAIPLSDPSVEGVMKLINSKAIDKALSPRRLNEAVTPSSVHDARAAVAQARQDLAMTKDMRKAKDSLTVNSLDMQSTIKRVNEALHKAHFELSSKGVEKEIKAAAPVRKLATMGRIGVLGGAATGAAIIAIPGAKEAVTEQATSLYGTYAP